MNIAGSVKIFGNDKKSLLKTQFCRWIINIPYLQNTYAYFEDFMFNTERTCAESLVTIRTQKLEYLFCSERLANIRQSMKFTDRRIVIEVIKQNWRKGDGFDFRFSDKKL